MQDPGPGWEEEAVLHPETSVGPPPTPRLETGPTKYAGEPTNAYPFEVGASEWLLVEHLVQNPVRFWKLLDGT